MDLEKKFGSVSFKNGKFLSDKSCAYDSVYFITKFVRDYAQNGYFDVQKNKKVLCQYIGDIFMKNPDNTDIANFYSEVLYVLAYSNAIKEVKKKLYKIVDYETIDFISTRMENAYIYLYALSYFTLKNSNLLDLYKKYCYTTNLNKKCQILWNLNVELSKINPSVKSDPNRQWPKQTTKYVSNTLNFLNYEYYVSRSFRCDISRGIRQPKNISVNVDGSKTIIKKNNDYFKKFDFDYVDKALKDYVIKKGDANNAI